MSIDQGRNSEAKQASLDGETIAYRSTHTAGPAVLLIHSLGTSSVLWRTTLAALSPFFSVVAMDCRGHGGSTNHGGFTLDHVARDALALMSELRFESFHLVGISMGGLISATMWSLAPQRVRSLVLANSYATIGVAAPNRLAQLKAALDSTTMLGFAKGYVADTLLAGAAEALRSELEGAIGGMRKADYVQTLEAIIHGDVTDALRSVTCPALVIVGDQDKRTPPEVARGLAALIPHAKLVVIEDAAHLSVIDKPAAFNRTIERSLRAVGH